MGRACLHKVMRPMRSSVAGHVRIGAVGRDSKGLMVELLGPGEIFGEIGVMDGSVRSADATAEGLVRLLRIGAPVFREALATEPALGRNLCRLLATRLRRTFALFQDATFESVEVWLARQILYLARRGGRHTEQGLRLAGRFRQGDLADMLGTTTRSIITLLIVWRQSGVVAYEPAHAQLTLTGEAALQALVERGATG
jgi:CRP/FNR family transcriptional regulator, cyclic AMP receptor protein